MRSIPLFFATFLALAQSPTRHEPVAIIQTLYAHPGRVYATSAQDRLSLRFFTPKLAALFQSDLKRHEGDAPNLDWDFMSNSQDPEVSQVRATAATLDGDHQRVTVRFLEMKTPEVLEFDFVKMKGTWLIDEVRCPMNGNAWVMSEVLKREP